MTARKAKAKESRVLTRDTTTLPRKKTRVEGGATAKATATAKESRILMRDNPPFHGETVKG